MNESQIETIHSQHFWVACKYPFCAQKQPSHMEQIQVFWKQQHQCKVKMAQNGILSFYYSIFNISFQGKNILE